MKSAIVLRFEFKENPESHFYLKSLADPNGLAVISSIESSCLDLLVDGWAEGRESGNALAEERIRGSSSNLCAEVCNLSTADAATTLSNKRSGLSHACHAHFASLGCLK